MIDIKKTRSSFQKYPTLKQKCDPILLTVQQSKLTASSSTATKVVPIPKAAIKSTAASIVSSIPTRHPSSLLPLATNSLAHSKDVYKSKLLSKRPAADVGRTPNNPVRLANQQFFLVPAFKDHNFLKEECELAHAQVSSPPRKESTINAKDNTKDRNATIAHGRGEDNRNNNSHTNHSNNNHITGSTGNSSNKNSSHHHNNNRRNSAQLSRSAGATTNGMRRSGNGSVSQSGTVNTAANTVVHRIELGFTNQPKPIAKPTRGHTSSSAAATLLSTSAPTSALKSGIRQVRPLVHRTIPATAVAAANVATTTAAAKVDSDVSYSNKVNNNNSGHNNSSSGNNNMQKNSLEHDDIKYIDSDDPPSLLMDRKMATTSINHTLASKARIRPKSTIICSSNQNIFEKVNNYKYTNGYTSVEPTTKRSTGIDSNSIKASIEKFNNMSEQKRLPLSSVVLRSQGGATTGSITNLQHHRHSGEFDNSNLRLPSSNNGSLPRSPYHAPVLGKVVTALHSTISSPSAAVLASRPSLAGSGNNTNSLPTKSSAGNRNALELSLSRAGERASTSSLLTKDLLSVSHRVGVATTAHSIKTSNTKSQDVGINAVVGASVRSALAASAEGLSATTDDSVRSSAYRSVLPPPSPTTSSRYWDRDNVRTSSTYNSTSNDLEAAKSTSGDDKLEGLCGLRNIGNTCFMNSVIQCLSHTSELTKFLRNHNPVRSTSNKDQQILNEFAKLIREMWTNNVRSVTPMDLKRAFSSKHRMYSDYSQQDAQEFLRFFLDALHCALNSGIKGEHLKIDDNLSDNKKADLTWEWYTRHENSLIRDLFVGQFKSTLRCTTCGNTSVTFDPFWDLSVPLPSSSRCKLDACLDLFIREEILDGDEMPTCSRCKTRRRSTKSFTIQRFPKILVIHLKRFSETRWSKLSNIVELPTGERELNMGPYGSNPNANVYYSLYGISNHMGSTAGGHYVALCKHPVSKKWHEFNDNIISDALSENHLVSSSAYILFYERA